MNNLVSFLLQILKTLSKVLDKILILKWESEMYLQFHKAQNNQLLNPFWWKNLEQIQ